jgi:CRP-like cAMP-binding protein
LNNPKSNHLLSALPDTEYQRISNYLEPVQLSLNQILLESHQRIESLYFPIQGVISLVSIMQDNSTTEIGLIGQEGMVGAMQFLGDGVLNCQIVVQKKGTAMRIDAEALREEYQRSQTLQKILLSYSLKLFNQVSQCAACNNHHTVRQRTARWLLMFDDRSNQETLSMTQQFLAQMLGVRRTGVSEVAKGFQRQGIIDYRRGEIRILDRDALEQVACECYQLLKI